MAEHLTSKRYEPPSIDLENRNFSLTLSLGLVGYNKEVLELGTSTGYVSKILTERGNIVTGIEKDREAASSAEKFCSRIIVGDLETLDFDRALGSSSFDVILCGDILEHLKDPAAVLQKVKRFLKRDGCLVVSLPHFFHADVLLNLLLGDFRYTPCGLLDQTHLRFFGRKNIYRFFAENGYQIADLQTTTMEIGTTELKVSAEKIPADLMKFLRLLPDATVYQYVFTARPQETVTIPDPGERDLNTLFFSTIEDVVRDRQVPLLQEISDLTADVKANHAKIEAQNLHLENKTFELQEKEREIALQEQELDTLTFGFQSRILALEARVRDHVREREAQDRMVETLEARVRDHVREREAQDRMVEILEARVRDHVREREAQDREIAVRDAQARSRREALAIKTGELGNQRAELEAREEHIHALEREIAAMEKSIVWQVAKKTAKNLIDPVFPRPSLRRTWLDLLCDGGRILVNDGFSATLAAYRRHRHKEAGAYQEWIARNELYPERSRLKRELDGLVYHPRISIIMPVWNTGTEWLKRAIESVTCQEYDDWELCIADGGSTEPGIRDLLQEYAAKDPRIKVTFLPENRGIAGNTNEALSLAGGEFVGFLDHDDELSRFCLYDLVKLLNTGTTYDIIYTDNDKIDESGNRKEPFFKTGYSLPALLSTNYPFHLFVCRRSLVASVGGLRTGFDGSQDYDLILRLCEKTPPERIGHLEKIAYHWRTVRESSARGSAAKPYAYEAGKRALEEFLARNHIAGSVQMLEPGSYRVKKRVEQDRKVLILVLAAGTGNERFIQPFTELLEITRYPVAGILVPAVYDHCFTACKVRTYRDERIVPVLERLRDGEEAEYLVVVNDEENFGDQVQKNPDWIEALIEHFSWFRTGVAGTGTMTFSNIIGTVERPCGSIFCIRKDLLRGFLEEADGIQDFSGLQKALSDYATGQGLQNLYTPFSVGNVPDFHRIPFYHTHLVSRKYFTKNMEFYLGPYRTS